MFEEVIGYRYGADWFACAFLGAVLKGLTILTSQSYSDCLPRIHHDSSILTL